MAKPKTGSERFQMQIEEQAHATAETQQQNSQLSQQVNELEDQLEVERAHMQERLSLERAEREQLEERLQQERAERERLLEEERRSGLEFEKAMMTKFNQQMAKLSQQMGSQQQKSSSPSRNPGARPTVISLNHLIQNYRMYKEMDQKK